MGSLILKVKFFYINYGPRTLKISFSINTTIVTIKFFDKTDVQGPPGNGLQTEELHIANEDLDQAKICRCYRIILCFSEACHLTFSSYLSSEDSFSRTQGNIKYLFVLLQEVFKH